MAHGRPPAAACACGARRWGWAVALRESAPRVCCLMHHRAPPRLGRLSATLSGPPHAPPSSACEWKLDTALSGGGGHVPVHGGVASKEACCGACVAAKVPATRAAPPARAAPCILYRTPMAPSRHTTLAPRFDFDALCRTAAPPHFAQIRRPARCEMRTPLGQPKSRSLRGGAALLESTTASMEPACCCLDADAPPCLRCHFAQLRHPFRTGRHRQLAWLPTQKQAWGTADLFTFAGPRRCKLPTGQWASAGTCVFSRSKH